MLKMLKKYKRFLMMDMLSISWVNCKITIKIKMMQCMHFFRLVLGKVRRDLPLEMPSSWCSRGPASLERRPTHGRNDDMS